MTKRLTLIFVLFLFAGCFENNDDDIPPVSIPCHTPQRFKCYDLGKMPQQEAESYCTGIVEGTLEPCPDTGLLNAGAPCLVPVYDDYDIIVYFYGDNEDSVSPFTVENMMTSCEEEDGVCR